VFPYRAPDGRALLTVFMGGARNPTMMDWSDAQLEAAAAAQLKRDLQLRKMPELLSIRRYAKAIPQYTTAHLQRLNVLRKTQEKFPGLRFAGNYVDGISVGDVVKAGLNDAPPDKYHSHQK